MSKKEICPCCHGIDGCWQKCVLAQARAELDQEKRVSEERRNTLMQLSDERAAEWKRAENAEAALKEAQDREAKLQECLDLAEHNYGTAKIAQHELEAKLAAAQKSKGAANG